MAALNDYRIISGGFSNEEIWEKVTYDFSVDTGAIADYDVFIAGADIVITDFYLHVETGCTSAGANVNDLGVGAAGVEFLSDKAVGDLGVGIVSGMDTAAPVKVASGAKVVLGVEAAAITAGKVNFYFKVKKLI